MTCRRLITAASAGLIGLGLAVVSAPVPAFAAPSVPLGVAVARAAADAHQIRIAWKPVSGAHHYSVEFFDGVIDTVSDYPANINAVTLDASNPCAKYLVKIGARDASDQGGTTGWVTVRSLAPIGVGGLAATRNGDRTTATATWRTPLWTGYRPITGYHAQLIRQSDNAIVMDRVVTDQALNLTGVARASKYTLTVTAQNEFGSCLTAKTTIGSDLPGVPVGLTASRTTAGSAPVAVSWQPPVVAGAMPTYYKVGYGVGKLTGWLRVNAPTTSAVLNLDPRLSWMLRVQSFNDVGGSTTLSNTVVLPPSPATTAPSADRTPPLVSPSISPAPNVNGWNNTPVTIGFICTDSISGVASCSPRIVLAEEGQSQSVTGTATDRAGNLAVRTATVNIDRTPPVITAAATPAPNAAGWHSGPVTVSFTCSDALSDIDVCPSPITVPGDIASRTVVTGVARDKAGNTANATVTVNIDRTAPTITATAVASGEGDPDGDGWTNQPTTVTFTCSDTQSGIASCPKPVTVRNEGANQVVSGTAVDRAGNAAVTGALVSIDLTAPVITPRVTGSRNANGWYNGPVTVDFTCTDELSGVDYCDYPMTLSQEGANQWVSGGTVDRVGNYGDVSLFISIDRTAPTITATIAGTNGAGWSNGPVTIHYTCSDALSGVDFCPPDAQVDSAGADQVVIRTAVDKAGNAATIETRVSVDDSKPTITTERTAANANGWNNGPVTITYTCADPDSGVATCSPPSIVARAGANQTVTGTATDTAGNTSTVATTVNIDDAAPRIEATVIGTKNGAGWYRGRVTVHFTCSDDLSGIETCPADATLDQEGANVAVTRSATDRAGNTATATAIVDIDSSQPVVATTLTGKKNAAGWYRGRVTVHFTCSDDLSGVGSCPADATLDGEGSNLTLTRNVVDLAGNSATVTVNNIKIDKTPPVVRLVGPANGARYPLDEVPAIWCQAIDSGSGVTIQPTAKITRAGLGDYTATCSGATDAAGNTSAAVTVKYRVTPTATALAALTALYITVNAVPTGPAAITDLTTVLARGRYCEFIAKVGIQVKAKPATLNAAQAAELTYWARILAGTNC